MRKHQFYEKAIRTNEQLMYDAVDAWTNYSEQKVPPVTLDTDYVEWKCFKCSRKIYVKYNTKKVRYMFCPGCRPHFVRNVNAILLRYYIAFKEHVNSIILRNTGLE